jgi:hypothetical protein
MRAWGAGVAAGHGILALTAALALGDGRSAAVFGLCALLTLALSLAFAPLLRRPPDDGDDGGSARPPDDDPPPWWPEFEREFRAYVDKRPTTPA